MSNDADICDPHSWEYRTRVNQVDQVTNNLTYTEGAIRPVPQNVPQPSILTHDADARTAMFADNNLPKRPCSIFFKVAYQALNMSSLFQDLSKIGIPPSFVRCLQLVSQGAYVITFSSPKERETFSAKSSLFSRPQREIITVHVRDTPFELPDEALKLRLQSYGEVLKITRGGHADCMHVETGIRYVKMHIDDPIPSFIRFGRRLVRTWHLGQLRTYRRCNQPGHQAKECNTKCCFNCEQVSHEAPDCTKGTLCSICKDPSHLAKSCPCGWIPPLAPDVPEDCPAVPPVSQHRIDPQPSQELFS